MKEVSKYLPQWINMKQKKEIEQVRILEKSMDALHKSEEVIRGELSKYLEFMKHVNEKVRLLALLFLY